MSVRILTGDALEVLRTLPAESFHCCVTSPPYWGLRDYGTAKWEGGDPACQHVGATARTVSGGQGKQYTNEGSTRVFSGDCACGARRIDAQLGLEPTPEEHVERMVEVFREVRRVLRPDGTAWVNYGDSYVAGQGGRQSAVGELPTTHRSDRLEPSEREDLPNPPAGWSMRSMTTRTYPPRSTGLKPKDLVGMPWLIAKALQAPYYTGKIKDERDRVWLAATIDGEGTICGFRHQRKDDGRIRTGAFVFITNSSTSMLDECNRIWPASRSRHMAASEGHLGKLQCYRWIAHNADKKADLLAELYPYLIVKKRQALIAWNLLQFVMDGKRLGRGEHGTETRQKRDHLVGLLSSANAGKSIDIPSWCREPSSLTEPGWYLRSDIIWHKPNPMPESVTDRPTKSHEYVFLLSKAARYFYDAEAVREPDTGQRHHRNILSGAPSLEPSGGLKSPHGGLWGTPDKNGAGRNMRSVWTIATHPFPGAHFATFPPELAKRCIMAGTSEKGCCAKCGKAWERVAQRTRTLDGKPTDAPQKRGANNHWNEDTDETRPGNWRYGTDVQTISWRALCTCDAAIVPCRVLDPFGGAGTTGLVADRLGRDATLIELNPAYAKLAEKRIRDDAPMLVNVERV